MNISLILAHPYEKSFNHGLAGHLAQALEDAGHSIRFHDLCEENFDPVMTTQELGTDMSEDDLVLSHQNELKTSDGIIVVHPNWWGQPPAVLKGWLDRVLRNGVAYKFGKKPDGTHGMIGLLPTQSLLVFSTSNTPSEVERTQWDDPLEAIWIKYVAGFCCIPQAKRVNFSPVVSSNPEQRLDWIRQAIQLALEYYPPTSAASRLAVP
jgi:putative NADPH-quinone reductase